jgi:hypothetical protein
MRNTAFRARLTRVYWPRQPITAHWGIADRAAVKGTADEIALSNETYLTKDGKTFEGMGVPPDIEVPIFPKEDLTNGRDSALDKVPELLAHRAR